MSRRKGPIVVPTGLAARADLQRPTGFDDRQHMKSIPLRAWIYFVQCGEFIKIGFSAWPAQRFDAMQACCPFPMSLIGVIGPRKSQTDEARLHKRFAAQLIRPKGEWFRASIELLDFIATNAETA